MGGENQDNQYREAIAAFGPALGRLARAYEAKDDQRRDLLQDIHLQLWRSFQGYDGRCSLRTWVYRVAHHVGASHVVRERRAFSKLASLEDLEASLEAHAVPPSAGRQLELDRLTSLIHRLRPLDRQIIILYLEELDAAAIAEIIGLAPPAVAMRVHRIKKLLARQFHEGAPSHAG